MRKTGILSGLIRAVGWNADQSPRISTYVTMADAAPAFFSAPGSFTEQFVTTRGREYKKLSIDIPESLFDFAIEKNFLNISTHTAIAASMHLKFSL